MSFRSMQKNKQQFTPRQLLENRYKTGRYNLMVVIIATLINLILALTGGETYFVFSASIPYYLVITAMYLCGRMPDDWYDYPKAEYEFEDVSTLIVATVIAALILIVFFVLYLLSKKHVGFMIAALALFALDTVAMFLFYGISADMILDIALHGLVLFYLISAVLAVFKLRKMPPDEPVTVTETVNDPDFQY